MSTPKPLFSDTDIMRYVESVLVNDEVVPVWDAHRLMIALRDEYERERVGSWQPVKYDDPSNDGPVWVDENGCVCWAGAGGEVNRLVLHGDMRLCLWVEAS